MGKFFLIIIVIFIVIALLVYNYVETGQLTLIPHKLTPREQEIRKLKKELHRVEYDLRDLEEQAKMIGAGSGLLDIAGREQLVAKRNRLREQIRALEQEESPSH